MKLNISSFVILTTISCATMVNAQNTSWKLNGNNISNGKYVGTNNNKDLVFKANGLEGFRLKSSNNRLIVKGIGFFQKKAIFKDNVIFKLFKDTTVSIDRLIGVDAYGKLKVMDTASVNYLTVLNKLQIGSNTLFLGSDNAGLDNYIYTTSGNLRINANEGQPVIQNTEINPNGGKIAIGTKINDPTYGLHPSSIYNTVIKKNLLISGNNGAIGFSSNGTPNYNGDNGMCLEVRPNGHPGFPSSTDPFIGLNFFRGFATGQDRPHGNFDLFISSSTNNAGYVGIGTPYPKSRLNVSAYANEMVFAVTKSSTNEDVFRIMGDGHVWCTELDIKLKQDFPDYVFAKEYSLMPLDELENYIDENKHLPNIPSAEEIANEGLNVGEMQVRQMGKIEELTLYLLQLKKELDLIKKENSELKQLVLNK